MASDKRLDQVKLVNSAESVLVVNGDQVEKATLTGFANSMGSSVPLQQTSEQVSITGLYARTSDGKMVELTKESVASVVAGLIGVSTTQKDGLLPASSLVSIQASNYSLYKIADIETNVWSRKSFSIKGAYNGEPYEYIGGVYYMGSTSSVKVRVETVLSKLEHIKFYKKDGAVYVYFNTPASDLNNAWISSEFKAKLISVGNNSSVDSSYTEIDVNSDVFGYNTLAKLSSGVAEQIGVKSLSGVITINPGDKVKILPSHAFGLIVLNNTDTGKTSIIAADSQYILEAGILFNGIGVSANLTAPSKLCVNREETNGEVYLKNNTSSVCHLLARCVTA